MQPFPPIDTATQDGLLAVGGDLSIERLVLAYRSGIFPWFNEGDPILWWSPDPRCILFPDNLRVSRSLGRSLRNRGYRVSFDTSFENVVRHCANSRNGETGTWITSQMLTAYCALFEAGVAHSVDVWHDGNLVGGLYGVALGSVFFGESMFSLQPDASKVALVRLVEQLKVWSFELIDCQVTSPHLLTLGAEPIPRTEFLNRLELAISDSGSSSNWRQN